MSDLSTYVTKVLPPTVRLFYWSAAWGISVLTACIGATFFDPPKMVFIIATILNLALGVGAIRAHMHWLKVLDEMQRKIQLEAMGLTLGALWIASGGLLILDAANIAHITPWALPVLAAVAMPAGTIIGVLKHR